MHFGLIFFLAILEESDNYTVEEPKDFEDEIKTERSNSFAVSANTYSHPINRKLLHYNQAYLFSTLLKMISQLVYHILNLGHHQ